MEGEEDQVWRELLLEEELVFLTLIPLTFVSLSTLTFESKKVMTK